MTILYLHQYFATPDSAGGTRSYDLSLKFIQAGNKVIIITSNAFLNLVFERNNSWLIIEKEGIIIHVYNLSYKNRFNYRKKIFVFVKFLFAATLRSLKIKADLVIATSPPLTVVFPAIIKKWINKTPYIFEVRDIWPDTEVSLGIIRNRFAIGVLNRFVKTAYSNAVHIVALSRDMKKAILKRSSVKQDSISVIPNMSVINRFCSVEKKKRILEEYLGFIPDKVVLYAGTVGIVNGLKYMIDLAFNTLSDDPSIIYVIIGEGKEKEELQLYSKELGINGINVFFLDSVPKYLLPQFYFESTVGTSFVASHEELWANSANKFFDCLAAGRPIVINHLGWMAEEIDEKNLGYILNSDTCLIPDISKAFCEYLNNSELLISQGKNAKLQAVKSYSLEIASDKYLEIINGY